MRAVHGLVAPPARADKARFAAGLVGLAALSAAAWLMLWAAIVPTLIGWSPVAVTSGSMEPLIATGDVVIMADTDGRDLGPGMVIVFDDGSSKGLVTHRIVDVTDTGDYITRGDANGRRDSSPVAAEDVAGVGRMVVPKVGHPVVWLQEGQWLRLVLTLALGVVAAWTSRWAMLKKFDPWRSLSIVPEIPRAPRRRAPQMSSLILIMLLSAAMILATTTLSRASFVAASGNDGNALTADILQPPTLDSASGGGSVTLNWTITPDTYAAGHRIYRSTTSGGPYTQVGQTAPRATATFTDTPANGTYYYVVRAFTPTWESVNSNQISETVAPVARSGAWLSGLSHATAAGTDRVVIFFASNEQQTTSSPSLSTVFYGGQPLVPVVVNEMANGCCTGRMEAWMLDEAGIAAASGTTFTPTWSGTPDTPLYHHAFFQNVDQTTPLGDITSAVNAGNAPNPIPVSAVTTTNNDFVVAGAMAGETGSYTAENGFTIGLNQSTSTGGTTASAVAGKLANGSNETVSMRFTNGPINRQVVLAIVLNVAP